MKKSRIIIITSVIVLLIIPMTSRTDTISYQDTLNKNSVSDLDAFFNNFQKTDVVYQELNSNYINYVTFSLDHRKKVLNWQYYSTIIIFIIVVLIVLTGLALSYIHFRKSLLTEENTETELELSNSGFKIRSSVIGIIILTISVLFFYLYLVHIYEIKEIKPANIELIKPISDD